MSDARKSGQFVSRGGQKLAAALDAFDLDVTGRTCADFGANVGGFTDCLLQRHAAKVYAVDTGYGDLAWTLRNDPRVEVMERTNALHCPVPEPVDFVVIDMAWTPQHRSVPAAAKWLRPGGEARIVSLLKPHYEQEKRTGSKPRDVLTENAAEEISTHVCAQLRDLGFNVTAQTPSPLAGKGGNIERLLLIVPPAE